VPARRLTARSVVASTLLGVTPPRLPTRSLVRTAELLGINAGTTRVAISRMVTAGELEPDGDGYRLASPALLARQSRQAQSRTGATRPWDGGTWRLAVVVSDGDARPAAERAGLRAALGALRYAELREGTWLRPDNLVDGVLPDAERTVHDACHRFTAHPDGDGAALAARLWPLAGWAGVARDLTARVAGLLDRLADGDVAALGESFVTDAEVLRHLQADPLLPAALLPDGWPGPALRRAQADLDRSFKAHLVTWLRAEP